MTPRPSECRQPRSGPRAGRRGAPPRASDLRTGRSQREHPVAPGVLRRVERAVGAGQEIARRVADPVRPADRDGDRASRSPRTAIGLAPTAARSRSAARSAPARVRGGQDRRRTRRPPQRASRSPPRTASPSRRATSVSTRSPRLVPVLVVDRLEVVDVDAHERRASCPLRTASATSRSSWRSPWRRFASPVRSSVIACSDSRRLDVQQLVVARGHAQRRDHAGLELGRVERHEDAVVRAARVSALSERPAVVRDDA